MWNAFFPSGKSSLRISHSVSLFSGKLRNCINTLAWPPAVLLCIVRVVVYSSEAWGVVTGVYLPKPWGLGEFVLYIIGPDILRDASQRLSSTRWSAQYSNHTVSDNHLIGLLHGTFDGYSVPITFINLIPCILYRQIYIKLVPIGNR